MCLKCSENHNDNSYDSHTSYDSHKSYDSHFENKHHRKCHSCYVPKCVYDCSPPLWQTWPEIEIKKCVRPCYPICNLCDHRKQCNHNLCNKCDSSDSSSSDSSSSSSYDY